MRTPSSPARSTRRRFLAAGTAVAAGFAGCLGFVGPDVTESGSLTFDLPDGVVAVENRNGDVRLYELSG